MTADLSRTIVLKARRDTIVLVVAVTAVTCALSSAIHSRPGQSRSIQASDQPEQHWTGELAGVTPADLPSAGVEPLTSASLVVPTETLSLPQVPVRALVKLRGCDGGICTSRTIVPTPVHRPGSGTEVATYRRSASRHVKPSLMSRLNPLNHLPDMSKISHPFAVAGDTVSGWFRRF